MSALANVLKHWQLFIDGRGKAGNSESFTPPPLGLKMEEFTAGGLDAPVDVEMGMEKLESSFVLTEFDPATLALWGVGPGADNVPIVARGSIQGLTGEPVPVEHYMRGKIARLEPGEWTGGGKATLNFTVSLTYYKFTQAGAVIHEIDVPNMVRIIGGRDALAAHRANIGLI